MNWENQINPALVFDLDGTLVDSSGVVRAAFRHALEPFGVELTIEDFEIIRSRAHLELFRGFIAPEHEQAALRRLVAYSQAYCTSVQLYPGIIELLWQLEKSGFRMAVWTARDTDSAHDILNALGVTRFFKKIVGSTCVSRNKPNPEGLLAIAREFEVDASSLVMIGDHSHDVLAARAVGCVAHGVNWGSPDRDAFAGLENLSIHMNPASLYQSLGVFSVPTAR